jgi:general secretion pathway protein K
MPRNLLLTRKPQRGIAILTVLVMVALVMTLAAVIFARQSQAVRYQDNYQSLERAWQYALSLEQFVGMELQRDAKSNQYDALNEGWATVLPSLPIEEGSGVKVGEFSGRLEDLQARYNLNNVINEEGLLRRDQQVALQRVVQAAQLPQGFASAISDWVDKNDVFLDGEGAESDYYLSSAIPYRAANMPFSDVSELRLLRLDLPKEDKTAALQRLQAMVTTLPAQATVIRVNANTASAEMLTALGLSTQQKDLILSERETEPYETAQDLADMASLTSEQKLLLGVSSQYFRLQGEVRMGRARVHLNSVFFRERGKPIRVIMRQFQRVDDPKPPAIDDASNTPAKP